MHRKQDRGTRQDRVNTPYNKLYNAGSQATYATKQNIILPMGSIEVKAAWKVLTAVEAASGRFHMAKGYIPDSTGGNTVPIGLVGFHVFASGGAKNAGLWATFYQIDNAPLLGKPDNAKLQLLQCRDPHAVQSLVPLRSTTLCTARLPLYQFTERMLHYPDHGGFQHGFVLHERGFDFEG